MSSLFALVGTMGSALSAQQAGLDVTGQNVANVNTPGYVARNVVLETQATMPGDQGGVDVHGIQRAFDAFSYTQVLSQQGLKNAADARSQALDEAQSVVAPSSGSVADAMNSFFSSVETLSANPSDPSARSAVLSQATQLAQTFSTTANGLADVKSALLTKAQGAAQQLNGDLGQIASLNAQIAQANAQGDAAPDLRDQRDSLVSDVSGLVGAKVVQDPSGSITLFAAGTALVDGDHAASLAVGVDASGAMQITVNRKGDPPADVTASVTGGTLGGLREARDVDVAQASQGLDQLAYQVTNAVNTVQQAGYGLDGVTGRPMFVQPTQAKGAAAAMAVDPSVAGNPQAIAAATSAADLPGGNDNAIALAQIASQSLPNGQTPASSFGSLAAQIGDAASAASTEASTRADTLTQAQNLNSSASGVSLNEEMVKLTQFQNAFQAATQVLQVANDLLGNFMQSMANA